MSLHPFCRYDLRTTDPDAARRFYEGTLGLSFEAPPAEEAASLALWPLHEQARARGVPSHWLGSVAVDDVEASSQRMLARGSEALSPLLRPADGSAYAVVRDPSGAILALRSGARLPRRS